MDLFANYPCTPTSKHLDDIYLIKFSIAFYDIFYLVVFHRDRKDFSEFVLHHIVTFTLMFFSYALNALSYGANIMLLHDFTDIYVHAFRLALDTQPDMIKAMTFFPMIFNWCYNLLFKLFLCIQMMERQTANIQNQAFKNTIP